MDMDSLIVGPAIVALLIACCGAANLTTVDCGMAPNGQSTCFDQAMQSCTPAKMRIQDVPVEARLTGSHDSSNCDVELVGISTSSWENELQSAAPSDYATAQQNLQNPQYKTAMAGFQGKTAQCVIPKGNGAVMGSTELLQLCHGDLMTFIGSIMNGNTG
jgi:hypothetical protein